MGDCPHKDIRLVDTHPNDERPALFRCMLCGANFDKNPNDPNGVRYLKEPNPKHTKVLPPLVASKY